MAKKSGSSSGRAAALFEAPDELAQQPPADLSLDVIQTEVAGCTRCAELASTRTQTVFGVGNPNARLCFLGEAPGADEDRLGEPFVGRGGQLLNKIIEACKIKREDVYILNMIKCRPPGNRDPEPDEMAACAPWLRQQLEVLDPALVITLGRFSMQTFLPGSRISQAHGTMRPVDPATGARDALGTDRPALRGVASRRAMGLAATAGPPG